MAMFDDTQWLLSHIQNSYATSDDSGLSEVVLQGNWPIEKLVDFDFLYPDDTITTEQSYEDPTPHSLDVHADQSYLGHRFRSDTEHRLNKMKKEKNLQAQITRITWQVNPVPLTESEAEELFGCHPVPELQLQTPASLLSRLLDQDDQAQNPYLDYAKWDASVCASLPFIGIAGKALTTRQLD
uniref:Target of rapamycin complex 2 subunit MAPKAP1-like n=1 Tax=Hirondellea gigas TaxID=1518452 RepID=A0A2P2IEJ3_9CRUS